MVEVNFKKGDILISKNGKKPFTFDYDSGYYIYGNYIHNNTTACFHYTNVKYYEETITNKIGISSKVKTSDGRIGFVVGKSIANETQFIVEIVSGGKTEHIVFDETELTEIVNFTCKVKDLTTKATKEMIFPNDEYTVKVGDLVLHRGDNSNEPYLAVVLKTNTKNKTTKVIFNGELVQTIRIK